VRHKRKEGEYISTSPLTTMCSRTLTINGGPDKVERPVGAAASQVDTVAQDDPLQGVYKAFCINFTYFLQACVFIS
jgi:hypothetical protein